VSSSVENPIKALIDSSLSERIFSARESIRRLRLLRGRSELWTALAARHEPQPGG
jgi:hypothetical protein